MRRLVGKELKVMILRLCTILFLSFSIYATGQNQRCPELLELAKTHFDNGKFYDIPAILSPCLGQGFDRSQGMEAYLLLTRVYLMTDDRPKAEESYLQLLELDPAFEADADTDPVEIYYLSKQFTTDPIILYHVKGGITYSNASVIQNYGTDNTLVSEEAYRPAIAFKFGGGVEWNWHRQFSLGAEINAIARQYKYTNSIFDGDRQTFKEMQNAIELPVYIKYRTAFNTIKLFGYIGLAADVMLSARAEVELIDQVGFGENQFEFTATGPEENLINMRNKLNRSLLIGFGSGFKWGYNFISLDLKYYYGLTNFVKQGTQYDNPDLLYKYGYVDDLKRMQSLVFTIGLVVPDYKPQKITDKRKKK